MQTRYLGDTHDCIKYALLRHLVRETGLSLGVNWYLTDPAEVDAAGNNHGEKRHHLNGTRWKTLDAEVLTHLDRFSEPAERTLENIQTAGVLPENSQFYGNVLGKEDREAWHLKACQAMRSSELVFLDPDNGFQVPSMSRSKAPKYALYEEFQDYINAGKTVVSIQFARQCDPIKRATMISQTLSIMMSDADIFPVVRGRVAPNILFFTASLKGQGEETKQALHSFVRQHREKVTNGTPLVELVTG
ncbi:hypothetical protein [Kordiimonas sp.]|uniref:hypothetical protein n=1 Tax=Kordiimonas sp. TaxID=1970157 RepID=UPI003B527D41